MELHLAYPGLFDQEAGAQLAAVMGAPRQLNPRQRMLRANVARTGALCVQRGFAARYRLDRSGRRQFIGVLIPGDFAGLSSFALGRLDHDIDSINSVRLQSISHDQLGTLQTTSPELLCRLWQLTLLDSAISRYWIFRIGRLPGLARIANFFCEMLVRQYVRGLCGTDRFELPLTQSDLGEACGMTPVHANRMIGELRAEGICNFMDGAVEVGDFAGLFRMGQYSWDYLYLPDAVGADLRRRLAPTATRGIALHGLR